MKHYLIISVLAFLFRATTSQTLSEEGVSDAGCDTLSKNATFKTYVKATNNALHGDSLLAIKLFNDYIKIDSTCSSAYLNLGIAYEKCKNYDQAMRCFNKSKDLNKKEYRAWFNIGFIYWNQNGFAKAIEYFNESVLRNPGHAKSYYYRGNAYASIKKYDLAFKDFNKAIELNNKDADFYKDRGVAYSQINKMELALNDYKMAYKLEPDSHLLNSAIAVALFKTNQIDSALYHIHYLQRTSDDYRFDILAAYCYLKKNDRLNACLNYKKAKRNGLNEESDEFNALCK